MKIVNMYCIMHIKDVVVVVVVVVRIVNDFWIT